uniref:Cytochrome c oxidase subunit 2 n=1 Tax=Urechis unicinctus TaxID=6432 RepID=C5G6E6_UREUN|nr:cytochrome c oxidase subunit II [Urechis unicinctus]ABR12803.1 cytochrome c oxidase subunit II [Urechis unicinctus]
MSFWGQLNFQDAASPTMMQLIAFHDHAMLILTLVISIVGYAMISIMVNKLSCRTILEAQQIETIWTVIPAIILLFLAFPSLRLLYLMEETMNPNLTLKAIGHQWYWSYEYSDYSDLKFDSYMLPAEDTTTEQFRLLEVDNRAVLPISSEIRVLVTAADVIHSWTVPSLGLKADAIPGRLNQMGVFITRPGVFYGQCSEICGANHSFMPIVIEAVEPSTFMQWTTSLAESS